MSVGNIQDCIALINIRSNETFKTAMSSLNDFANATKGLSRNPLGIIALFIVLIYGFASLVVGFSGSLQPEDRLPIVWFLVVFPVIVLAIFAWLVSQHHEKLYAPKDFTTDEAFLRNVRERSKQRQIIIDQDMEVQEKVREKLTSAEVVKSLESPSGDVKAKLEKAVDDITREIRNSSSITIDARAFTGDGKAIFQYPVMAFSSLGELLDELYFRLNEYIEPYEYGYTWVLKESNDGVIIKNARMITRAGRGNPVSDVRTLRESGIKGGMTFEIVKP